MILAKKQECVKMVLERVKEKLFTLSEQEYIQMIVSMLEKAEKGDEVVFSQKDKQNNALMEKLEQKHITVSSETRPLQGRFYCKKRGNRV